MYKCIYILFLEKKNKTLTLFYFSFDVPLLWLQGKRMSKNDIFMLIGECIGSHDNNLGFRE